MNSNVPGSTVPPSATAVELCRYFTLTDGAKVLLKPDIMPDVFAQTLLDAEHYPDALQVIAHYLPKRQAVFWAMTCVRHSGDPLTPDMEAALTAAEKWIADPADENRKAALKASEAADSATAAGCTALAAFYSDGLPRTDDPRMNAKAHFMTAKLVSAAVLLCATSNAARMKQRLADFSAKGLEIVKKSRR